MGKVKIEYFDNVLTAEAYAAFQRALGHAADPAAVIERALAHSLYTVSAMDGNELVGMGRLVGDGAMYWYLQDVCILPRYQGVGVGTKIVYRLLDYAAANSVPGSEITVGLMAAAGRESFYERFGFRQCPNRREGAGMQLDIKIE